MKDTTSIIRKVLLILVTGVILTSCEKDKDNPEANLTGTWATGTSTFAAKVGDKTITQYFTDVMGLTASDAQLYTNLFNLTMQQSFSGTITLKSDKTYTSNLGGQADSGTWSLSPDSKKLTIDSATDPPIILDVVKLTATELQVRWSESGSEDLNDDNVPEAITVDVDMTFTKQ